MNLTITLGFIAIIAFMAILIMARTHKTDVEHLERLISTWRGNYDEVCRKFEKLNKDHKVALERLRADHENRVEALNTDLINVREYVTVFIDAVIENEQANQAEITSLRDAIDHAGFDVGALHVVETDQDMENAKHSTKYELLRKPQTPEEVDELQAARVNQEALLSLSIVLEDEIRNLGYRCVFTDSGLTDEDGNPTLIYVSLEPLKKKGKRAKAAKNADAA